MHQLEQYYDDLNSSLGVPNYPALPTHFEDPTVTIDAPIGQSHLMTQTLNTQYPQTSPITLGTFQDTMGPERADRTRTILDRYENKPGLKYTHKVNPVNAHLGRPDHLNKDSQVLLNDPKFQRKDIHYIHTQQKPELATHNTLYNHSRKAYDLGEKKQNEDFYHTARRTPYQATKDGRDELAQKFRVVGTEHAIPSKPNMEPVVNLRSDYEGWRPMTERVLKNEDWIKKTGDRLRREAPKNGYFGF